MARLGRSYVFPQIRRNPQAAAVGPTYNDTVSGTVALSGTATEAHAKDEGTKSGTVALSGARTESHVHTVESSTYYGDGTYGGGVYGGAIVGTIPLSGAAAESFEPPGGGLLDLQRRRRQYGN